MLSRLYNFSIILLSFSLYSCDESVSVDDSVVCGLDVDNNEMVQERRTYIDFDTSLINVGNDHIEFICKYLDAGVEFDFELLINSKQYYLDDSVVTTSILTLSMLPILILMTKMIL